MIYISRHADFDRRKQKGRDHFDIVWHVFEEELCIWPTQFTVIYSIEELMHVCLQAE